MKPTHVRYMGRVLTVLIVLLALIVVTGLAAASTSAQTSGSGGEEAGAPAPPPSAQEVGDDPDEEGYEGGAVIAAAVQPESSGEGDAEASEGDAPTEPQPDDDGYAGPLPAETGDAGEASGVNDGEEIDWRQLMEEPQPDEDDGVQGAAVAEPGWTGFRYIFVAGSTLRPRDSGTNWNNDGSGGCVYATSGGDVFNIHLDIPNGSRIDYLRIYYYDTSGSNSQSWLTTYNGSGGLNDRSSVASTGNSGYGTRLSAFIGHVANTSNNAYVLNWRPNQIGSSMRLCGFRVAYRLPT